MTHCKVITRDKIISDSLQIRKKESLCIKIKNCQKLKIYNPHNDILTDSQQNPLKVKLISNNNPLTKLLIKILITPISGKDKIQSSNSHNNIIPVVHKIIPKKIILIKSINKKLKINCYKEKQNDKLTLDSVKKIFKRNISSDDTNIKIDIALLYFNKYFSFIYLYFYFY